MPNGLEITKAAIDDFKKIQDYMIVAKEEGATKTYAKLKDEYLTLKALLNVSGGITKVSRIVAGGKERFHSVWNGLRETREDGYVFIHDSARPFVDEEMLSRLYEIVRLDKACVAGMPVKDTIKIVDPECKVRDTPDRGTLWMVQTPQVFETKLVKQAYKMLIQDQEKQARGESGGSRRRGYTVTDDAGAVEIMLGHPVRMVKGSYKNIKITTPEDLEVGEVFAGRGNS